MLDRPADKLEIFMALALGRRAKQELLAESSVSSPEDDELLSDVRLSPTFQHLTGSDLETFKGIVSEYQARTEIERGVERRRILRHIGSEKTVFVDKNVHRSHIGEALRKEIPAIQKILSASLISTRSKSPGRIDAAPKRRANSRIEELKKTVCHAFFGQFTSLRDLPSPTAFDRLSSTQLVRLIRLSGIREVAVACSRIEEVESVAAFLRRFSAEDARAIAAQLSDLRDVSDARLSFAEGLVQATLEQKPQPSEMLDLLGIRLVGIVLCESKAARIAYTSQKLPLEITPKLTEIIEQQCRKMPKNLQRKISAEIEHLAEAIARTGGEKRSVKSRRKQNQ